MVRGLGGARRKLRAAKRSDTISAQGVSALEEERNSCRKSTAIFSSSPFRLTGGPHAG